MNLSVVQTVILFAVCGASAGAVLPTIFSLIHLRKRVDALTLDGEGVQRWIKDANGWMWSADPKIDDLMAFREHWRRDTAERLAKAEATVKQQGERAVATGPIHGVVGAIAGQGGGVRAFAGVGQPAKDMSWPSAVAAMQRGEKVSRRGDPDAYPIHKDSDWMPRAKDLVATDWYIVREKPKLKLEDALAALRAGKRVRCLADYRIYEPGQAKGRVVIWTTDFDSEWEILD